MNIFLAACSVFICLAAIGDAASRDETSLAGLEMDLMNIRDDLKETSNEIEVKKSQLTNAPEEARPKLAEELQDLQEDREDLLKEEHEAYVKVNESKELNAGPFRELKERKKAKEDKYKDLKAQAAQIKDELAKKPNVEAAVENEKKLDAIRVETEAIRQELGNITSQLRPMLSGRNEPPPGAIIDNEMQKAHRRKEWRELRKIERAARKAARTGDPGENGLWNMEGGKRLGHLKERFPKKEEKQQNHGSQSEKRGKRWTGSH